jgi:hypothetical protein
MMAYARDLHYMLNKPINHETENQHLKEENEKLRLRLNTMLAKDITVLPVEKAVECPAENKLIIVKNCRTCDYCKIRIILNTVENISLEYIYCAYKEVVINND